jgi:predicted ATPase
MITKLNLINFKCFEEFNMKLKEVNVFTGLNGMGKSTAIQALLLLVQSYYQDKANKGLLLNGKYIELGLTQDVVYDKAQNDILEINITSDDKEKYNNRFEFKQDMDFLPYLNDGHIQFPKELVRENFVYISAYRIKPHS